MPQLFLNNFQTQFIASVKAMPDSASPALELDYGVLRVSDGAAGLLLNPIPGSWYVLTSFKRAGSAETDYEVMHVTAVDNAVIGECRLTVLRGQEGTTPKAYVAGDIMEMRLTAGGMNQHVQTTDARMVNARAPAGAAGGVLSGEYPNPGFAQAMATAADLGGKVDKVAGKVLSANDYTNAERVKLANVAEQATKNATDADLRDRASHTGTQAIATVSGLPEALDGKQPTLVSGENIKTINGATILGGGDIVIAGGSAEKKFYFHTANTTLPVPTGQSVIRFYAGGNGGDGTSSNTYKDKKGGGGGGFAFGDIPVQAGDMIAVAFSTGVVTVKRNGVLVATANPGVLSVPGTASINGAIVVNGGAYSGGAGGNSIDQASYGGGGGGSCGSPLGNGFSGGPSTGANSGSGAGIGGPGGTDVGGAGAGESGGGAYGGGSLSGGRARGLANSFSDPLLRHAIAPRKLMNSDNALPGAGGAPDGSAHSGSGGDFGGGGCPGSGVISGQGGLMGGGGGGRSDSRAGAAGGYGAGGGGGGGSSQPGGQGGPAFCFLYY